MAPGHRLPSVLLHSSLERMRMSLILGPLFFLLAVGIFILVFRSSYASGKREAAEAERREAGVGPDFDAITLPGTKALGSVSGRLSAAPHNATIVAPLSVATAGRAMACAQATAALLDSLQNNHGNKTHLLHGKHFARLTDGSRKNVVVIDAQAPFVWHWDGNAGRGRLFYVGPLGPDACFELDRESGLGWSGPEVFLRFVRGYLETQPQAQSKLRAILDEEFFCGATTTPAKPSGIQPWYVMADAARASGIAIAGPVLYDREGNVVAPDQAFKQHYGRVYRFAKDLEEPRITLASIEDPRAMAHEA